ncbi:MAG TPA: recombinase family protein [Terriglobales bacterium]|nr:recombinase family protein [Terriglobales bacterium]
MSAGRKSTVRCAIYTRKSSEEGLEQSFNSLDAQREASQAFVVSQRHEGWRALETHYDDGGYSGGNMDRPALRRLLDDVTARKIDTVVVYKVDRLTRSLADFAKIIEAFDAHGVSFVSVTQQFNTTTSMGRLTLNVLLSFAQFERELTGERIRDKIAASKSKGMWMGGRVPLGYDLKQRKLLVNLEEAKLIRTIYQTYLELGCVSKLKVHLDRQGVRSKVRISASGTRAGGAVYSRGALYALLQNQIYLGEITHGEQTYPGEHEAIVSREVWDKVQTQLRTNHYPRRNRPNLKSSNLLTGLLQDAAGNRFTPSHTVKAGKRYRYYVCQQHVKNAGRPQSAPARIPAYHIEKLVLSRLQSFLRSTREVVDGLGTAEDRASVTQALVAAASSMAHKWSDGSAYQMQIVVRNIIARVIVYGEKIELFLQQRALRAVLFGQTDVHALPAVKENKSAENLLRLDIETRFERHGGEIRVVVPPKGEAPAEVIPSMLKAVARAHQWYERIIHGESSSIHALSRDIRLNERYVSRVLRCAFLAPDIVEAILNGRQPADLKLSQLFRHLPPNWSEQRRQLGFSPTNRF